MRHSPLSTVKYREKEKKKEKKYNPKVFWMGGDMWS
jgi:hypothetical protein